MNFYKEELLDHFKNPRNNGTLDNANIASGEHNPSCGDSIEIQGIIIDKNLQKVMFTGKGCVISQASASMLTEFCTNKTVDEIKNLDNNFITQLIGISFGPTRIKCALLALVALHKAIK